MADAEAPAPRRSDLPVRVASAAVMVALAGTAFWLGGWVLNALIIAMGLGIFAEWVMLVLALARGPAARALWLLAGAGYIGFACSTALALAFTPLQLGAIVISVIAVDVGAYFAGRGFGGPKIAPAISPSKTWSGLGGGALAACAFYAALALFMARTMFNLGMRDSAALDATDWIEVLAAGLLTAVTAQAGDFFESWMKRRAGVKDSGRTIPGHGGVFDRADGLIAVLFVVGIVTRVSAMVVP